METSLRVWPNQDGSTGKEIIRLLKVSSPAIPIHCDVPQFEEDPYAGLGEPLVNVRCDGSRRSSECTFLNGKPVLDTLIGRTY
jgi:hypothetical protein